ncbi:MAG TPA: glutaredoxin family protein [Dehalococcoidia bacterium]|nr:glutaredoxin family protein [Dehalococcoidia bacterium]
MTREITLFTRQDCGLCHEAAADLRTLQHELDFALVERDIDADPDLRSRYNERVPVIAAGDEVIAESPIDIDALRRHLAAVLR